MYTNFNVAVWRCYHLFMVDFHFWVLKCNQSKVSKFITEWVEVSSSASHMIDHLKPFTFWNSCTDIKHNGTLAKQLIISVALLQ